MTTPSKFNELNQAEEPARILLERLGWTYVPREELAAERSSERGLDRPVVGQVAHGMDSEATPPSHSMDQDAFEVLLHLLLIIQPEQAGGVAPHQTVLMGQKGD